mmetsp:Transcript_1815/g.4205  ORF Transcript_1815/g.4205 Transcript_1815/m.4205 type:complete len:518 (-) Transcript_1815:475-2028(-)|eukprot:CAMPEP_0171493344 /NCGR_PEP_ID=MMETSP0958-20121227/4911_1 /TAXON_ID=87120 /ORGANISM="Aurantiochytrium limacinum, Strain ATCCMYA-1381" /LENGTH=517 /DNA_ID=CAMNT_0012026959 /DNA_START=345 /DNA_END=1898 /DNA_ORIENTATION=+
MQTDLLRWTIILGSAFTFLLTYQYLSNERSYDGHLVAVVFQASSHDSEAQLVVKTPTTDFSQIAIPELGIDTQNHSKSITTLVKDKGEVLPNDNSSVKIPDPNEFVEHNSPVEPFTNDREQLLSDKTISVLVDTNSSATRDIPQNLTRRLGYFLHIHKGGGTSVCKSMKAYGENTYKGNCNMGEPHSRANLASGSLATQKKLFDRMLGIGRTFVANEWMLPSQILKQPGLVYITLLRNPLARTESHYAMAMKQAISKIESDSLYASCLWGPQLPDYKTISSKRPRESSRNRIYFARNSPDNWQTRALCGTPCAAVPFGALRKKHLTIAKKNLVRVFDAVGILEQYSESMNLFRNVLQIEVNNTEDLHLGTHHSGESFVDAAIGKAVNSTSVVNFLQWFYAVNLLDIQLYNFGRILFKQQMMYYLNTDVDTGPSLSSNLTLPNGVTYSNQFLSRLLQNYVKKSKCTTTCCGLCAPIGHFWRGVAYRIDMIPTPPECYPTTEPPVMDPEDPEPHVSSFV